MNASSIVILLLSVAFLALSIAFLLQGKQIKDLWELVKHLYMYTVLIDRQSDKNLKDIENLKKNFKNLKENNHDKSDIRQQT